MTSIQWIYSGGGNIDLQMKGGGVTNLQWWNISSRQWWFGYRTEVERMVKQWLNGTKQAEEWWWHDELRDGTAKEQAITQRWCVDELRCLVC